MNPIPMLAPDVRFQQRWEFRDGRSELSSDDSQANNHEKMQERGCSASQLPSPESDRGKERSSRVKAKRACKSRRGNREKAKSAKKKRSDFVNFDISVSNELQAHMRSVLGDLEAEREKMSAWMREEVEKMLANGVAGQRRGKNSVPGHTCVRKRTGRSKSGGPNEISIDQVPRNDGNEIGKQKAADSKRSNIGHDSASIPLGVHNIFDGPGGRDNPRDMSSSGAISEICNEKSLMYYPPPNGFLNYSATIPRCPTSPLLSNGSNRSTGRNQLINQVTADTALTHPGTITYPQIPLLAEGATPAGGQLMERFWIGSANSMVSRLE